MKSTSLTILGLMLSLASCLFAGPPRTLAEVQALSDDAARAYQPVQIEAVVIYADPSRGDTIIHDGSAACFIYVPLDAGARANPPSRPQSGDRVRFHAFTQLTGVTPHLEARSWEIIGRGEIPEPRRLAADEIYTPRNDAAWIEVPAVVIGVETGGIAYTL
ncbi:MAG: hypothetical protein MUF13_17070, partial [Akkermansiaceae bacterium]|nr:hypothetical protein [Akkermansiaceae bacterium]